MPYRVIKSIDGRRGAALMAVAFIFIPISWSQVTMTHPQGRSAALSWLPSWIDHSILGWALLACSGTAFLIGLTSRGLFRKKYKWRARLLAFGFQLMFIPPGLLMFIYGTAMVLGLSGSYVSIFAFGGYAWLLYIVSGWEEPRQSPPLSDQARALVLGASPSGSLPTVTQEKNE